MHDVQPKTEITHYNKTILSVSKCMKNATDTTRFDGNDVSGVECSLHIYIGNGTDYMINHVWEKSLFFSAITFIFINNRDASFYTRPTGTIAVAPPLHPCDNCHNSLTFNPCHRGAISVFLQRCK